MLFRAVTLACPSTIDAVLELNRTEELIKIGFNAGSLCSPDLKPGVGRQLLKKISIFDDFGQTDPNRLDCL